MWNFRSRCIPGAVAFLLLTASVGAQDAPDSDDETLPP
jgi:hypothetical protein